MPKKTFLNNLIFSVILISCQPQTLKKDQIQGAWYSEGYGLTLVIEHDNYRIFDTYSNAHVLKYEGNTSELLPYLDVEQDTLSLQKGTTEYRYIKEQESLNIHYPIAEKEDGNVFLNYEAFAETVGSRFAFSDLMSEPLHALIQSEREKLVKAPTGMQLYKSLEQILKKMNDNHGYLEPEEALIRKLSEEHGSHDESREDTGDNNPSKEPEYGDFQVADRVADIFLDREFTRGTSIFRWGVLNDSLGFIQLKAMWLLADLDINEQQIKQFGYVDAFVSAMQSMYEGAYIEKERKAASELMDTIMKDLKNTKGLLLDVRFNGGGQDVVSMEVLKHLNDRKKVVAFKKAKFGEGFSDQQPLYLPGSDNPYLKPVFLLTSKQSASATDLLTLASLQIPHIIRIGSNTQGAISDALVKKLPNGWTFALSNELYTDLKDTNYEYIGIAPNIELNYPESRQPFFRDIMQFTLLDKKRILEKVDSVMTARN